MSAFATGTELRRFRRGIVPKLAIVALILIPLLYGALYLWAFWDPTGRMDQLPVALVNADQPVAVDGEELAAGSQVTEELTKSGDLGWQVTDEQDAEQGVRDGRYYFAVTIPADFSERISSAAGDDPQNAEIYVTYNDANSFLASTLGRSAMTQVQGAVREKISDSAIDRVLVGLGSARDGFAQASDGAVKLGDGLDEAADGASTLAAGADDAADGSKSLADGASALNTGATKLSQGATTLTGGAADLADGASSVDGGAAKMASSMTTLSGGASKVKSGTQTLAKGTSALADGAAQTADGAAQLATGSKDLATGAADLKSGAAATQQGAESLRQATGKLATGFTQDGGILAGVDAAASGATDLAAGLASAQSQVDALPDTLDSLATLITANDQALAQAGIPETHPLRAQNAQALAQLAAMGQSDLAGQYDAAVAGAAALADADAGLPKLASALHTASDGVAAIEGQLTATGSTASPTLRDGIDAVAAGSSSLAKGASGLSTGAGSLATGASKVSDGADNVNDGAASLKTGTTSLATGAAKATTGAATLADGTHQLSQGAAKLSTGATSLESGAATLATGTDEAANGASALADGTAKLASGAHALGDGVDQAADGGHTLATKLHEGADSIPDDTAAVREARAQTIAAPVTVQDSDVAQAEGFGEGFAPFFISLALFVGSLISWLLLLPTPPRALDAPVRGARLMLRGYLPAALIGIGQVVVMLTVIHFGLGLQMANPIGVVAFTMLIAVAFVALQQMFIALAGPAVGKVIILAFLMLQLASSGGTYPVPTTAGFFQVLHPWLPMSYAVTGLRQLITGGADGRLVTAILYLAGLLVVSLAVTAWRSGRMRTWSLDRLHPAISM